AAQALMRRHIPKPTMDDIYAALLKHMDEAASYGLTAVTQAIWDPEDQPAYLRALAADKLKLRFNMAAFILTKEGGSPKNHKLAKPLASGDLEQYRELRSTFRGPLIKFGAIKALLDGTVDAKTAAMFDPYVGGGSGIPFWDQGDLNQTVALYDKE